MFNGSENFNDDYFKVLQKVGATDLNGTTNTDRTNYFQNVPTPALDTVLWMESDRMGYMLKAVDKAKLDEQRGVVQNEKRQGENQPYGLVYSTLAENTWPAGHPYSWSVIGSMEDLNAASLDDVHEWFKTYYGPSNATIVIAGDIDPKTAREKVEKYFGAIPAGPPITKQEVWIAKRTGTQRQTMQDRVPQARIYKVWNIPPALTAEADYFDLFADILAVGRTSRLYRRLVYTDQIATDVSAFNYGREIAGQFVMYATARPGGDLKKVEAAMDEEFRKLLTEGPSVEELERVKTRQVAGFLRGIERIGGFGGKSDVLAQGQVYAGNPDAYKQSLERTQKATVDDVKRVANEWLTDGVYVLEVHPFPRYAGTDINIDRSKVPEPGTAPDLKLPKIQRGTLSNGLKIMLAERHEVPIVNWELLVNGGHASDGPAKAGTAQLATSVMMSGTKTRNAIQISEEAERLGAEIGAGSDRDDSSLWASALKMNLDKTLDLWADVLLNPAFTESEFRRLQKQQLAAIEREKTQAAVIGRNILTVAVFGPEHPYGTPPLGNEATVKALTRDDLAAYHRTYFKPNNGTLLIVGDTTLAEIVPELEKRLAPWKAGEAPKHNMAAVTHKDKPLVYLFDRPGSIQSHIYAGHIAPARNDRHEIAMETLNQVLGSGFIARINMNLREDKHWSYGARALFINNAGQRLYHASAPVQTDKTKESMVEILKEFRDVLQSRPVTQEELSTAQQQLTLRLPGSRETMNSVRASMGDLVRYGLPDDYYEIFSSTVRALSVKDMATAAERLIHPDKLVWVIVGDRSKIESGIKELNLGELRIVDADGSIKK
jgi:zinc protease